MLSLKRARERASLLAALFGVVALVCLIGAGLVGGIAAAERAGIRDDLASRTGLDGMLQLALPVADDPDAQDAAVREAIDEVFHRNGRSVPLTVERSVTGPERAGTALWTITPIVDALEVRDLRALAGGWNDIGRVVQADDRIDDDGLERTGRLVRTASAIQARIDALGAITPVALIGIATVAIMTIVELAQLLDRVRAGETLLRWSRGTSTGRLVGWTIAEAALVACTAAALGTAAAVAAFGAAPSTPVVPAAAVVTVLALTAAIAVRSARSLTRRERPDEAGRTRSVVGVGGVALVVLAASLATWQLLLYGSPVNGSSGSGDRVDPVAVAAVPLLLLAIVLVAFALLPLAARAAESRAARRAGLGGALLTRTISRRLRIAATPFVLVALATGQLGIAAGYAQTWRESFDLTTALRSGADVQLADTTATLDERLLAAVAETSGVDAVAPVMVDTTLFGAVDGTLVGVAPAAFAALVSDQVTVLDPGEVAVAIAGDLPWPVLDEAAETLRLDVDVQGFTVAPTIDVVLAEPSGALHTVRAAADQTVELPDVASLMPGGLRVMALEVGVAREDATLAGTATAATAASLVVTAIDDGSAVIELDGPWVVNALGDPPRELSTNNSPAGFTAEPGVRTIRMQPRIADNTQALSVPVVISRALADRSGATVGTALPMVLAPGWRTVTATVAAIVDAVPGSSDDVAALVDIGYVQAVRMQMNSEPFAATRAWLSAGDPATAVGAVREVVPSNVRVASLSGDLSRTLLGVAATTLWTGAIGAALLALTAVAAVAAAQSRMRSGEARILRALGLGVRPIVALRRRELAAVVLLGGIVGLAAGALTTWLAVPALASAAVPEAYTTLSIAASVAVPPLLAGIAALGAALAVIVAVYGAGVARQLRRPMGREELS